MKAAVRKKFVDYKNIRVEEISTPEIKPDEILIKVHATTISRTDCALVNGKPYIMRLFIGFFSPKSPFLGTDFVGEIQKTGGQISNYKVGDRIMGFRDEGADSQREYAVINKSISIEKIPDGVSYMDAVGSIEGAHYAYNWIKDRHLDSSHNILINGATGAIGSSLIQMVRNRGCKITAVANTKNIEKIKALGAHKVYNYESEDFTKDLGKYDYVFDAVGKSSFGKTKHLLKRNGIYISSELGPYWQNTYFAIFGFFKKGKKVIFPIPNDIKASLQNSKKMLAEGKFKPIIDREYPIEHISDAYQYVASGQKTGNVILSMK